MTDEKRKVEPKTSWRPSFYFSRAKQDYVRDGKELWRQYWAPEHNCWVPCRRAGNKKPDEGQPDE